MNFAALAGKSTVSKLAAVPVTIDWPREKIIDFLKKQYANNVDRAEHLLKLQLWLDVQKKLDGASDEEKSKGLEILARDTVSSFQEYPSEIARSVMEDHMQKKRQFSVERKKTSSLPF